MLFSFVGHIINTDTHHLNQIQDNMHNNLDLYNSGVFFFRLIIFLKFKYDLNFLNKVTDYIKGSSLMWAL